MVSDGVIQFYCHSAKGTIVSIKQTRLMCVVLQYDFFIQILYCLHISAIGKTPVIKKWGLFIPKRCQKNSKIDSAKLHQVHYLIQA